MQGYDYTWISSYPELLQYLAVGHGCDEQLMDQFPPQRVRLLYSLSHSNYIPLTWAREKGERREGEEECVWERGGRRETAFT